MNLVFKRLPKNLSHALESTNIPEMNLDSIQNDTFLDLKTKKNSTFFAKELSFGYLEKYHKYITSVYIQ